MAEERNRHFNQKPRRKAQFITPPNRIKQKVGHGGVGNDILGRAQDLLESVQVDFPAMAEMQLDAMTSATQHIRRVRATGRVVEKPEEEELIDRLLHPALQLKAHGGMFKYDLVTKIADNMVHFLEVVIRVDDDAMDIIEAHNTTLKAIVNGRVSGDGGEKGKALLHELHDACLRYFHKHKTL